MGLIKQIWYGIIKKEIRLCRICDGKKFIIKDGFFPHMFYEKAHYSNASGIINIKCPGCNGNGILFGNND